MRLGQCRRMQIINMCGDGQAMRWEGYVCDEDVSGNAIDKRAVDGKGEDAGIMQGRERLASWM